MKLFSIPVLILGGFMSVNSYAQEFRSFVGATNTLWESPSNWNPNLVPDSITEGARIENGANVIVGGSHTISALEIKAGSLAVNQSNILVTSSLLIDSAGSITGPGTLTMNVSGAIDDGSGVLFSNVTFRNEGTLSLFNGISLGGDAVFENVNTTLFVDGSSISLGSGAGAPGKIVNTGFLRKHAGTGSATISVPIDNQLEISSTSGTLLVTGDIESSGQIRTEAGGTVTLSGTNIFNDGASIFGSGTTQMNVGTLSIPGGSTVSFDNFSQLGGIINGGGVADYLGTDNVISSGVLAGTVTSRVNSGAVLSIERTGNGPSLLDNHAIEILDGGTLRFTDENSRLTSNGVTTMMNHGLIEFQNDGDISQNGPSSSTLMQLINAADGSVVKSGGTGETQIIAAVTSAGEWRVLTGDMTFFQQTEFSAPLEVASGSKVTFSGPSLTPSMLSPGSRIFGGGLAEFKTPMEIPAGPDVEVDHLDLISGKVEGNGVLKLLGPSEWNGGVLGGSVTLEIAPAATLAVDGSGGRTIDSSSTPHIANLGRLELTGIGNINSNGAATFFNGGTMLLSGSGEIRRNSGINTVVENPGVIVKDDGGQVGSGAISFMQIDLTHTGTMDIQSGILTLQGSNEFHAPVLIGSGATVRLDGSNDSVFHPGSSIDGDGIFEQRTAEIIIADGARVPIRNYTTQFGSGRVSGTGTLVIANDTTLTRIDHRDAGTTEIPAGVTVSGVDEFKISEGRNLHVLGTLTLPLNFNTTATNGASIENDGVINIDSTMAINHGGGAFAIRNDGVIRCNAGGTSNVNLPPDQYSGNGRLEVNSGRLRLTRAVSLTGTIELAAGTQMSVTAADVVFAPGSTIQGVGTIADSASFGGTVSPGLSIGALSVNNNASFDPTGVLAVELGNGGNDELLVTGTLDLGGLTISPSLVSGYTPASGTTWDIATAGSITGSVGLVQQGAAPVGSGFFVSVVGNQLRLTYSVVDSFQKAYEAATGLSLGVDPDLSAIAEGDVDSDGRADLLDWAFGGTLGGPDPGRELIIDSVTPIGGGLNQLAFRYPINALATDVNLTLEKNVSLSGSFSGSSFTPTGNITQGGILFQQATTTTSDVPSTTFIRMRASLP